LNPFGDRPRWGMAWRLDPPSPLEVHRGIRGEPPPEEGRRLLRLDRRESPRLLNEALRLLLEVCGRLTILFLLVLLDLGLGEERFGERELAEDRLSNLCCSSLDKTSIVDVLQQLEKLKRGFGDTMPNFRNNVGRVVLPGMARLGQILSISKVDLDGEN
jgi:hypothetical protein